MLSALDQLGTIAAVAQQLHLTAPGVSMQLAKLERELGVTLTERRGRRVALTPAGSVLAAHGRDILDRLSLAEYELDALRSGSIGHYALTAFPSAARTFVADTFRQLLGTEGCGLELTLTTLEPEPALDALTAGAVDVAVIHSYSNTPRDLPGGIVADPIGSEPVWLAVRALERRPTPDHTPARGTTDLREFAGAPWITPTPGVTCHDMVERACGIAGFRPRVVAETMDFAVQLELVAAGVGVALVPFLTIDQVPEGVELLELSAPVARSVLLAVREPSRADPGIRNLRGLIMDAATARLCAAHR